jgi:hypothetical protein
MAIGKRIAAFHPLPNPKGIVSSSPGLRAASYPGLADGIPLGFAFSIRLVGNAQATANNPRPPLCLLSRKQRGTRNRGGRVSA